MKRWLCEDSQYLQMDGKKVHAAPWSTMEWDIPSEQFVVQQFTGEYDKNKKEIYEGDVINFDYLDGEKTATGVVQYNNSYCAYVIDSDIGTIAIMNISLDSLEVIGNMVEDYTWNEEGTELIRQTK
jgi:uncharacterized phage protein (TIGR01671 family)